MGVMPALIRFQDGAVFFGLYQGSSDSCSPLLYDSCQLFQRREHHGLLSCACRGSEPVDIWTSYGGGSWWKGRACRACRIITHGLEPHGELKLPGKGQRVSDTWIKETPDWVEDVLESFLEA